MLATKTFPQIKEFVKHGKTEGYVEIELCAIDRKNPVIKRKILADSNSSVWFINEAICKQADVSYYLLMCWTPHLIK